MKEFTKFEIAAIKRTAQNCYSSVSKKNKLIEKINKLTKELEITQRTIDRWEAPIIELTGYTTDKLVKRVSVKTGVDPKTGKDIMGGRFELIYPETVIPTEEATECKITVLEAASNPDTIPDCTNDTDNTNTTKTTIVEETILEEEPIPLN